MQRAAKKKAIEKIKGKLKVPKKEKVIPKSKRKNKISVENKCKGAKKKDPD